MEAIDMIRAATGLFAASAAGGVVMATIRMLGQRNPPSWLAMAHGLLAGAGLTLLIYAAVAAGLPGRAMTALVLLLVAAAGGVVMNLAFHTRLRPLPVALMLVHAALAVVAFVLLLTVAFG